MNRGFWDALPKPFFILAPMYDVTDVAFRQVVAQCGRPDVFFTEFVSTDGLMSAGRERLAHHLLREPHESPLVAQVFGAKPDMFRDTGAYIRDLGFDGMDINMGCPDKNIIKGGSCAALFKTPELARDIVHAAKEGAGDMPVSVKIRIGDTKVDWEQWITTLLQAKPAAMSIHLRTRKEMSKVPAHWELMPHIVSLIHRCIEPENRPLIIGNGDVLTLRDAKEKALISGCDGVMIGRGVFQNPWVFREDTPGMHTLEEKAGLLLTHAKLYEHYFAGKKPFEPLKRFYKIYINGVPQAAELREELYKARTAAEVQTILMRHKLLVP